MKMPHTPGPWAVWTRDAYPGEKPSMLQLPWVEARGGAIASVKACPNPRRAFSREEIFPDVGDEPDYLAGWSVGLAIAQANARLIALAPEMAEAIVEWVDILEECGGSQAVEGSSPRDLMRLAAKIRKIKGVP